jgi:dynein assembly factor 2
MSLNPYAGEDFNKIKIKGKKPEEKKDEGIDHPLYPGKKLDMSQQELKTFTKAMEQKEFKEMMSEYVDEISNPKHRPEQDKYLEQLRDQGEIPPGHELIRPRAGFCMKTSAKKLISEINKQFFDQKTFINVCFHDIIEKPEKVPATVNGTTGYSWSLPYRVSKPKND